MGKVFCDFPVANPLTCPQGHAHCFLKENHEHYTRLDIVTGASQNITVTHWADCLAKETNQSSPSLVCRSCHPEPDPVSWETRFWLALLIVVLVIFGWWLL